MSARGCGSVAAGSAARIAALAVLAAATTARAEPAAPTSGPAVELRYAAPAACPTRDVVEGAIRERMPDVRFAPRAHRVFAITIEPSVDGFAGVLVVDAVADKQLAARRCDDLVAALALVTAIAIDPTAVTLGPPPTAAAPAPALAVRAALPPKPRAPSPWTMELAAGGAVASGISPGALFAGVLAARAEWRHRVDAELALVGGYDSSDAGGGADGMARFLWLAARPAACWVPLAARGFDVAACAHAEIGAVRAGGADIVNGRDLTRLWLAAGGHLRARVPLGARAFAQLQLGASAPFVRDRYLFAPNVTVHQTAAVTGWLSVGVGLRFP